MDFIQGELESFPAKHNLVIEDISLFLFSQFSYKNISLIRDHFGLPDDKIPLVYYDIGGALSPFVALHDHLRKGHTLNRGEYVLIWTLVVGYQSGMMLWEC